MSNAPHPSPTLSARNISKRFAGAQVLSNVSLRFSRGDIHALIGPNGAGKSTLINILAGSETPNAGQLFLDARDITGFEVAKIARLGIARSFQLTNIFLAYSVWENVRLAAQIRFAKVWQLLQSVDSGSSQGINANAEKALELCALSERKDCIAGALSHGEQRQLEIAICLATTPQVLLLDEPFAGMSQAESQRMMGILQAIHKDYGILLVEHDMDAVFALAQWITVLDGGAVIASGTPAEIRSNAAVRASYFGAQQDTFSI